jgi:arylsulfatase A-like enzyme
MGTFTRREFVAAAAGAQISSPLVRAAGESRPNILFALADDWGWPFASIAGDPVVRTPTFDRVAREGVLFRNAFVSAPSCSPSRAAILTGQWHWRPEEGANLAGTLSPKFPVYPDLLENSGYHVGFTRKGWAPGSETAGGRTRNPAGVRYEDFASFLAARPKDKPFCFWFGSVDPHRKYEWESGVKSGMRLEDVKVPPYLPDDEIVRKDICDYYAEVQRFDRETGELLSILERSGEQDNTIVVMTGDNGWPFPRAKASLYDAGTHVPLAIRWPARVKGGRVVEDAVSSSDFAPTFLEAAGLERPRSMTLPSWPPYTFAGPSSSRAHG